MRRIASEGSAVSTQALCDDCRSHSSVAPKHQKKWNHCFCFCKVTFSFVSDEASTDNSRLQVVKPVSETSMVCFPADSLRVAGASPTKAPSTLTSPLGGVLVTSTVPTLEDGAATSFDDDGIATAGASGFTATFCCGLPSSSSVTCLKNLSAIRSPAPQAKLMFCPAFFFWTFMISVHLLSPAG